MSKHVGRRGKAQRAQIVLRDSAAFAALPRGPERYGLFLVSSNRGSRGKNGGFYEKRILEFDNKGAAITGIFHINPKRTTNPAVVQSAA
jgi:hypothetical protein